MQRIRVCLTLTFTLLLIALAANASAQPAFVSGLVIPGNTLDATKQPGAKCRRRTQDTLVSVEPALVAQL
jgi:hypothetical protein